MSGTTEVGIEVATVAATVVAQGLEVAVTEGAVTAAVVGIPGPRGAQGEAGPQGEPGTGLPAGGTAGQVPVKIGPGDGDIGWAAGFTLDPAPDSSAPGRIRRTRRCMSEGPRAPSSWRTPTRSARSGRSAPAIPATTANR